MHNRLQVLELTQVAIHPVHQTASLHSIQQVTEDLMSSSLYVCVWQKEQASCVKEWRLTSHL